MKCTDDGHTYELDCTDGQSVTDLEFIQKELRDGAFVTVREGTTNEEVIRCLIDRIGRMNLKAPCRENSLAITKLEEALMWLEKRTADRKARGVEGTPAK